VLVRYNAQGDRALNKSQAARLKLLEFLAARNCSRFMFELLVPAEKLQLDELKGDKKLYDLELRLRLMVPAIRELQDPASIRICGPLKVWIGTRIRRGSRRPRVLAAATQSAALFLAAARSRMARNRCECAGFRRLRSRSHRFLGSAGCLAEQKKRRASMLSRRSQGAIASSWTYSSGKTFVRLPAFLSGSDQSIAPPWRAKPCN
jgi:hypothetical protein